MTLKKIFLQSSFMLKLSNVLPVVPTPTLGNPAIHRVTPMDRDSAAMKTR